MFERYTERARRVIFFARFEASQFGSTSIESEHFLLGLIREDRNIEGRFVRDLPPVENIRKEVEARTTIREKVSTSIDLPLTDECKRILSYATEEAERLKHRHIGTEHLLLGILREEKSLAAKVLQERGLRLSIVREQLSHAVVDRQANTAVDPDLSDTAWTGGVVPDAITASRIAQAIWAAAYGNEGAAIPGNPQVTGNHGNWKVVDGPLYALIQGQDGKVLAMGRYGDDGLHLVKPYS
jgi:ATP-dependent Clp protease ATP-binding subunit ClpA